jgi:hypothetical protein
MNLDPRDRDLIVRTIIGEAASEPDLGKQAVAEVILNRLNSGRYGSTARDVLMAPRQFEPWGTRASELLGYDANSPAYQSASTALSQALRPGDPTSGATHFLNADIVRQRRGGSLPSWARGTGQQIGQHTFLAPEGRVSRQPETQEATMLQEVTDPDLIRRIQAAAAPEPREVTDPDLIRRIMAAAGTGDGAATPDTRIAGAFDAAQGAYDPGMTSALLQRAAGASAPSGQGSTSTPQAVALGLSQGGTLGFGDEITAAQQASGVPAWANAIPGVPLASAAIGAARTFADPQASDEYSRTLEQQRAYLEQARREHPIGSMAGEVGGALMTVPATPAIAGLRGAGWAGRAAEAGLQGAGLGGLYAFGSAEGGLENRAENAAWGGALGAATGAVASPVIDAAGAALRGGVRAGRDALAPFTQGGREAMAARTLDSAATDPQAVRQSLAGGPQQLVPGSMPTTFQQTGDMGLGALERGVATRHPAEFMTRRGEQNTARIEALEGIQPGGDPMQVSAAVRQQFRFIDETTQREINDLTAAASSRAERIGGTGTPDSYGEGLRSALTRAEQTAREQERALWRAVDPDNSLALGTGNVRQEAQTIARGIAPTARPMEGEEAALFKVIEGLKPSIKFNHASALRSRISTALRQELFANGRSPVYARLSQLREAVERDLEGVIAQKTAQEADAVAAGTMQAAETVSARVQEWADAWTAKRGAQAAGGGDFFGSGSDGAGGQTAFSGVRGTAGEAGAGFRGPSRDPGLSADAGGQFDRAALDRLRAASAATKQRAETFDRGTPGQVLRRSGQSGPYNVPAAVVPQRIFKPDPAGAASVQEYRRAVGDGEAMRILRDYTASDLRRIAERPDGTLDPNKLELWRRRYADALKAFPDLDRQMTDAARATAALDEAAIARRAALDNYQKGIIGRLLNVADPDEVTRYVGAIFGRQDSIALMRRLLSEAGNDPAAREGIRKSVVDYLRLRFIGNTEAATTGQGTIRSDRFQEFIKQNRAALRMVLSEKELQSVAAIADDLQRANRSVAAVKLPGGSNTAQDTLSAGRGSGSLLGRFWQVAAASGGFLSSGGWGALAAWLGTRAVMSMRAAGVQKVDELIRDALLDPGLANILLLKTPFQPDKGAAALLGTRYRNIVARLPAIGMAQDGQEEPAR